MIDKLKEQPLLGLALAIAGGYILAHIAIKALDLIYETALDGDPASAAAWLIMIMLVACAAWKKRAISVWIKHHAYALAWTGSLILCAFSLMAVRAGIIDAHERTQAPVVLDMSKSIPLPPGPHTYLDNKGNPICPSQQDPAQYAHLLDLQKRMGIPPSVANGNDPPGCNPVTYAVLPPPHPKRSDR